MNEYGGSGPEISLHTIISGSELIIPKTNAKRNLRCFGEKGLTHRALRAIYPKIAVTIRKLNEKTCHKKLGRCNRYNVIRTTGRLIINKNNTILNLDIFILIFSLMAYFIDKKHYC